MRSVSCALQDRNPPAGVPPQLFTPGSAVRHSLCSDVRLCPQQPAHLCTEMQRQEVSALVLTMCDYWFTVTDHRHTGGDAAVLGGADDVLHNDGRLRLMYMDTSDFSSAYAICAGKAGKKRIPVGSPDPHGLANRATGEELLN